MVSELFKDQYKDCIEAESLKTVEYSAKGVRKKIKWEDTSPQSDWKSFEFSTRELLMNLGAEVINFKNFEFDFRDENYPTKRKRQIDAIGYLEFNNKKFLLIAECKHHSIKGSRNVALKGAYDEIKKNKNYVKKRIRKIFKDGKDIIPIWILASKGHVWSVNSQENFLKQGEIIGLGEEEQDYFNDCYDLSRSTYFVFNQFLGSFKNKSKFYDDLKIGAMKTTTDYIGKKTAYTFTAKVRDLMPLSFVSHRRQKKVFSDKTSIADRTGNYQRVITKKRITAIAKYLTSNNKPFTNNILVSYRGRDKSWNFQAHGKLGQGRTGELSVKGIPGSFHVIDGQHRLFSYSKIEDPKILDHELIVTAFKDLSQKEEAKIFLDVNNGQTKVDIALRREVQMILGSSSQGQDQVNNLITSIIINLREDNNSPFKSPVCIPLPEGRNTLPFQRLSDAINNGMLVSSNGDFKKGYLNVNDDYELTLNFATEFLINFFEKIKNSIKSFWIKPSPNNKNVALKTNFIGGCIFLLERIITEEKKGQIINPKKLEKDIAPAVDHLCAKLKNLSDDQISLLFGWVKDGNKLTEGGNKYPLARYYLIKELMMDYNDELLYKNDIKEEIKSTQEEISYKLNEFFKDTEVSQIAQTYEIVFWQRLDLFLKSIFGIDYWTDLIFEEFPDKVFTPATQKKAQKKKSKYINLPSEKQDALHTNEIDWCDWAEIKALLEGIYSTEEVKSHIVPTEIVDLKKLINETFFIKMPDDTQIPQSTKQGLKWIDFISELSNLISHPREGVKPTTKQKEIFDEIKDNLYGVIDNMARIEESFTSEETEEDIEDDIEDD